MYLQLMICDNVCQVWPWKAKRAWRWTGRVKWLSSCPHKPLCSGTYNDNNFWVIWMYCRFLKRISFKNIWSQIFWVPWQGIFYIVLENSWNYFTLSRASCTCTCIYLKHPIQKEWERWPDFTFYISFML